MAAYRTYSDHELVSLLKQGDHAAFTEIFERYYALVVNFTAKRVHDFQAAEDIVQEVFTNLWRQAGSFELKSSLGSYLHRAALNRMLNYLKHEGTKQAHIDGLQAFIAAGAGGTDYRARERVMEAIIQKEISTLPPKTKEVFELRRKQHLTNRQIGETLSISEQTVETHMKKALKHLRTRLGLMAFLIFLLHI